jgi:Tfp pilus assembly protein PilF
VMTLARELSERAAKAGNLRLGVELLERLRARDPADETVWRPLLEHYLKLRDGAGLERLIAETLPLLAEVGQRNELRVARARYLLAANDRDGAAAEALRDVLLEDPRHGEALAALAGYYERTGSEDALTDLLEQLFDAAAESGDREAAVESAVRLGEVLQRSNVERAVAVYRKALGVAPGRRELLSRLLALTPVTEIDVERAAMMEDLLATERGPAAARLAEELAEAWSRLGDRQGMRRVLEKGCAQAPDDSAVSSQLEQFYRAEEAWGPLADLLAAESERQPESREAAALLYEAASLRLGHLADPRAALDLLRRAHDKAPDDHDILTELARTLAGEGELPDAISRVKAALERCAPGTDQRLALLLLRAELEGAVGDHRAAVAALEEANASWPDAASEALASALMAWREGAAADMEALREATLKLAALMRSRGGLAEARKLVEELIERGGPTAETATLVGELAESAGDLEGALAAAHQLLDLEQGEAQVAAAERLANLTEKLGRPGDAAAAIEAALAGNPGQPGLLGRLTQLYERTGELRKLAVLLYNEGRRADDEGERFEGLRRAGAVAIQADDGSFAMMALTEALAIRPRDEEATLLLSDAYTLAGALEQAAELLRPLIVASKGKASPALAALHVRLARIAARSGNEKGELESLGRALEADKKNGTLAAEVADRAEAAGDHDLAMKALRAITLYNSPGPVSTGMALLRQAKIAHSRGEKDRAILYARRAAQEAATGDPVQAESREFLRRVGAG